MNEVAVTLVESCGKESVARNIIKHVISQSHYILALNVYFHEYRNFSCTKLQTSGCITCALSTYGCLSSTRRKLHHLELTWEFCDSGNSSNAVGQQIHMPLLGAILSRFVFFICENNV